MLELVESVKRTGRIIQPVIARPREGKEGVETIAGHRRLQALIMAGLETAPAIVEPMDDDTATIIMVDTNLGQRTHLLFSEKAFAYRMKLEALNHQGERNDLTSVGNQQKLTSRQIVASDAKVKESEVQQYIRLTYLIEPLLDKVDYKELLFTPAVDISYLKNEEQIWVGCALEKYGGLTTKQSALIKQMSKEGTLTESAIEAIMRTEQPLDMKVTLKGQTLQKYFPKDYTPKQMQEVIINLLEGWKKEHQRDDMKLVR
ncbi:ParB family chromosome partitioning protein [Christensenella hongkongensis]|nr:ParB family chromosome partitioning protein [Christensenella hongkongensis]